MIRLGWTEKWTLRFAVVGLLFLALSGFEGMLMRTQLYAPESLAGMELELSKLLGGRRVDMRTAEELSRYFRQDVVRGAAVQFAQG